MTLVPKQTILETMRQSVPIKNRLEVLIYSAYDYFDAGQSLTPKDYASFLQELLNHSQQSEQDYVGVQQWITELNANPQQYVWLNGDEFLSEIQRRIPSMQNYNP